MALDVGNKRVGIAVATHDIAVPRAIVTLERTAESFWEDMQHLLTLHQVNQFVVGLPRGLDGQETAQTRATQTFAKELTDRFKLPLIWQDEALTSVRATETLQAQGVAYNKGDVDALAASYILGDYLQEQENNS